MRPGILLPLSLVVCLDGCGAGSESSSGKATPAVSVELPPAYGLSLRIVDEDDVPLPGAALEHESVVRLSGADGRVEIDGLLEPAVLVASATGYIPEPLVLGPDDAAVEQQVRLRRTSGPGGARIALHFGGDIMMGRRYVAPTLPDTHVMVPGDGGVTARGAVSSVAPLFRAADLRMANIETVIGTLPDAAAYPGKRFLLQSPPELVDALKEMGLDVACLANNHIRDWLEPGIASTVSLLTGAGIRTAGAGTTEPESVVPAVVEAAGRKVGVLSYCAIRGDSVNEAYPADGVPPPPLVDPLFAFKYEARTWGHAPLGIPERARRIRGAWEEIEKAEETGLTSAARAALWSSAAAVYPELQDWVARRGHGGANNMYEAKVIRDVAALRDGGCDLVAVMLHNGHEYADFRSRTTVRDAHRAIDAGADIVVAHHGHTQQGFEFYKGKLICLGLGNCVFDQDFLSTMLTGVLRAVFEGDTLIEARYLPMTLLGYRPAPLTGRLARTLTRLQTERSAIDARTDFYDGTLRAVLSTSDPATAKAAFRHERNAAVLSPWNGATETVDVAASRTALADLPETGLTRSRSPAGSLAGLLFGRDLLRWGSFEDELADGTVAGGPQWRLAGASPSAGVPLTPDAPSGARALHLIRTSSNTSRVRLRMRSLVSRQEHRLWLPGGATAADGPASYSLRFRAKKTGTGPCEFTLDVYNFSTSFADGPDTVFIRSVDLGFEPPADGAWHDLLLDIPAAVLAGAVGLEANGILLYVGLHPPASGTSELRMDDLRLIEWREPEAMPDLFYEVGTLRAKAAGPPVSATLERRPE